MALRHVYSVESTLSELKRLMTCCIVRICEIILDLLLSSDVVLLSEPEPEEEDEGIMGTFTIKQMNINN